MTLWNRLRSWLRTTLDRSRMESDMDAELRFHLESRAADLMMQEGISREQARRRAHIEFGAMESAKEECREERGVRSVDALLQDLRYAVRMLRKNPSFAAMAILTLALGIGACTAIFSVVENVLVEPFPYPDADRFMTVEIHDAAQSQSAGRAEYSGPEFLDYAQKNHVFDRVIANASLEVLYNLGDGMERFHGVLVTPGTFEFFGMPAMLGRVMQPADYEPGASPVFVLRYKTWVADFAADPAALNKTFVLNGVSRTLIGVMPPRFGWGDGDVFIPERPSRSAAAVMGQFPPVWYLVGHLKSGVSVAQAQADLTVIANQLVGIYPRSYPAHFRVELVSVTDMVVGHFRSTLYLTSAAVALLLLIACANVANLLLARAAGREKELALRATLGATRSRLVRQMATESLLLAFGGAALGVLLASAGLKFLVSLLPPRLIPAETVIRLNIPVLLFALLVTLLTPLIFGLLPALSAARGNLEKTLRGAGKGASGDVRHSRLHDLVIVVEVALSFSLLVGAGLLMRSFIALRHVDLGMRPDHVLVTQLPLPTDRYQTAAQVTSFFRPLLARLKSIPGVLDAAESTTFPPVSGFSSEIEMPGQPHAEKWTTLFQLSSENYFSVLRLPLLEGRVFSEAEVKDRRKIAVVNQTFVRNYLGAINPIGQHVELSDLQNFPDRVADPSFEIVGVVADAVNQGLEQPIQPEVWIPYTVTGSGQRGILVRTAGDPTILMNEVRRAVWATDRSVALSNTGSLENFFDVLSFASPRFGFVLMSVFAAAGLFLVTIGVYGVVAYATARRRREIGIRMALGAERRKVFAMVLGQGARLVAAGIVIGLLAAFSMKRLMASFLHGVQPTDPPTLLAVSLLLVAIALPACYLPARRATRVDPMVALRDE